jgi:8-oxo-dGTP diphosphatase
MATSHSNGLRDARETTGVRAPMEACGLNSVQVPTAQSYGGVLLSLDGRVLLREPIDHLDGYVWTLPKGRSEDGENPAQTALREVHEETGYRARIVGGLPRAYVGTTRTNAFFLMEPIGEPGPILNETARIRWVSYSEAYRLISYTKHAVGRRRDRAILDDALNLWSRHNERTVE